MDRIVGHHHHDEPATTLKNLLSAINQQYAYKALQTVTLTCHITWPDGIVLEPNEALCRVSGYTKEELHGAPCGLLLRQSDYTQLRRVEESLFVKLERLRLGLVDEIDFDSWLEHKVGQRQIDVQGKVRWNADKGRFTFVAATSVQHMPTGPQFWSAYEREKIEAFFQGKKVAAEEQDADIRALALKLEDLYTRQRQTEYQIEDLYFQPALPLVSETPRTPKQKPSGYTLVFKNGKWQRHEKQNPGGRRPQHADAKTLRMQIAKACEADWVNLNEIAASLEPKLSRATLVKRLGRFGWLCANEKPRDVCFRIAAQVNDWPDDWESQFTRQT